MIKAVLIDDERPALRGLEHLLKEYQMVEISGMFTNPLEAIKKIGQINPQIVFLDINMPQLTGIDVASTIIDRSPDTDIIFVTAYDQYAVEAFELHALDYILKPISKERFAKTLQRVMAKNGIKREEQQGKLVIKCLGSFQMGWLGQEPVKWRTEKTRELFAFLLQHQGQEVTKDKLIDQLWAEVDVEKAVHQLHNGIYYIRKTLEQYGIDRTLISISGNYKMKLGAVEVDYLMFQERLERVNTGASLEEMELVEGLCTGEYLEGTDWLWADLEREKLSRQYGELVVKLAREYVDKKEFVKAEHLLLKSFKNNPFDEKITELLLQLYKLTGDTVKGAKHFMEYTKMLEVELGIKPWEGASGG